MMLRSFGVSVLILISSAACALSAPLNQAKYVTMPDGVRIAVEIWLPSELKAHQKIPAVIAFTRYWRAKDYLPQKLEPPTLAKIINGFGYAYVVADVRGSGASFGTRRTEFLTAEVKDYYYIIDRQGELVQRQGRRYRCFLSRQCGGTVYAVGASGPEGCYTAVYRF